MAITVLNLLFLFELEVTILGQGGVAGQDIMIQSQLELSYTQ